MFGKITKTELRFRSSTPVAVDDKTVLVADDKSVFILNADTGEMSSCTAFGDYNFATSAQPVIDSGKAYIPTANKGLIAFDIESKKIVWEMMPEQAMVYTAPYTHGDAATVESTPLLKDGQLIFGASDGYVYRVNAADGQVIAKAFIGAPVFGKVVLCADGSVIAADFAGRVTRTELE